MPFSAPAIIRKAIGNIINPEDISRIQDAVLALDGIPDGDDWDGQTGLLTPGDDGDQKATVGGVISNVKPGVIDLRVRGMSPASSDDATLMESLLASAATDGAVAYLPDGEYRSGHVTLPASGGHLQGPGTIKMRSASPQQTLLEAPSGGLDGLTLDGVTLDGLDVARLLRLNAWPNPITNVLLHRVGFFHTDSDYEYDAGLEVNLGDGIDLDQCVFDCEAPVRTFNTDHFRATFNDIRRAGTRNAFDIQNYDGHDVIGLLLQGNHGRDLYRMGVELVRQNSTGRFLAPVFLANDFAVAETHDSTAWMYSTNFAEGLIAIGNTARYLFGGTLPAYGFELRESHNAYLAGNYAYGFDYGISSHSSNGVQGIGNIIEFCNHGVELTTAYGPSRDNGWFQNRIINPLDVGFIVPGYLTESGNHEFASNLVVRDQAFTGDSTRAFDAFQIAAQFFPSSFHHNLIVQGMAAPTLQYFVGMRVYWGLGDGEDSAFYANQFRNLKTSGSTTYLPLVSNGGAPAAADALIPSGTDVLKNILTIADGTKSAVTSWS